MASAEPADRPLVGPASRYGAILVCVAVLPVLLWAGHPALALLTGAAIAVVLDRHPLPASTLLARYSLQSAIVLLGLKLELATLWSLSADYTWAVATYVLGTLALGLALGRLLAVETTSSHLISAGTAICGGTAIATLSPLLRAEPQQTGMALAIVFLLNVVALLTFPTLGRALDLSQVEFGLWTALAIHDTSSVVATATLYGEEAAEVATTLKLGRTLWLIPLAFAVSVLAHRQAGASPDEPAPRLRVPGFILAFVAAAALGSVLALPDWVGKGAGTLSRALLVIALFLVGTELTRSSLRRLRGRVLGQAVLLWLVVVPVTLGAVLLMA